MDIQISHQWMDGFVKAAEANGIADADIPQFLKLAGVVAAFKRNPQAFDAGYQAQLKRAGWFGRAPAPAPGPTLMDYLKQLPAVQAVMRRIASTRDFNELNASAIANSRQRARQANAAAIMSASATPARAGAGSVRGYGDYSRPTFML